MIVTYQGLESFKISQGDLTLAVNPNQTRAGADITLVSARDFATSDPKGFLVNGPGEYEVKGVGVKGFASRLGNQINTIYTISFEGMNLCFLGVLPEGELPAQAKENLENIDLLFVAVGDDPAKAAKIAVSLEPSVIIPMHYSNDNLKKFLKEAGDEGVKPIEKLVAKKKDLDGKEGEIIVLEEESK